MENLELYNAFRTVPETALKEIKGGRLKGYSDINPVWRLKTLTEQFGPCGIGWRYEVTNKWIETTPNGETAAFVDILLYYKHKGSWSYAIPGTGGSMFVSNEKSGAYTSDECFKMALTDALSVACKALGIGADVYWEKDASKYNKQPDPKPNKRPDFQPNKHPETDQDGDACIVCGTSVSAPIKKASIASKGEVRCIKCMHK